MKIAVAGTGYVGLSIVTLLPQHNTVTAVDIIPEKEDLINRHKSPIRDEYIEKYLAERDMQYITAREYADVNDILFNTIGAAVGSWQARRFLI